MGGLVAKRFIDMDQAGTSLTYVGLFISIAAPWGGIESAESGVKRAPVAIPSWVDISPESKFLSALYAQSAALEVPHALLFAYQRDRESRLANSDGRVTLKSQLEPRIRNSAFAIDGVNADHSGILQSEAAFENSHRSSMPRLEQQVPMRNAALLWSADHGERRSVALRAAVRRCPMRCKRDASRANRTQPTHPDPLRWIRQS